MSRKPNATNTAVLEPPIAPILVSTPVELPFTASAQESMPEPATDTAADPEPDTRRNKGRGTGTSDKSIAARGVPADSTTIWIPFVLLKTERDILAKCAKHRNIKLPALAAIYTGNGLTASMPDLTAEAAEYDSLRAIAEGPRTPKKLTTMTQEQLRAYVNQQQALIAQAQEMLDALPVVPTETAEGVSTIE